MRTVILRLPPRWLRTLFGGLSGTFRLPAPFPDASHERAFLVDYGKRFAPFRRAAVTIGFLLWTAFLWWDHYNHLANIDLFTNEIYTKVIVLRGVGVAALLTMVILSLLPRFASDRFAHVVLLGSVLCSAFGLIAMVVIVPPPLDYMYYFVGLYLVLIFMFGFLHLRAKPVLTVTLIIASCMLLVQNARLLGGDFTLLSAIHFPPAAFFFTSTCVIGFGICVKFEHYARQQYAHERQLSIEQDRNMTRVQALLQSKEEQRKTATEANHNKSRFLASAAHDLRQPMFGLSLSLEALRHAVHSNNTVETMRLLLLSQRSARVMANSFNAVLDLSKLESGFVAPELSHFDLIELVDEVRISLSEYARSKRCVLRIRAPAATRVMVHSDRLWLGLVIKNLVSNGIKYGDQASGKNCAVLVGVVRLGHRIRLDVADNGVGIPPGDWNRIFQPFIQLGNAERDREKGLGLGLSIVNAIISILDQHRLEFKSQVGHGTRFSIDIPKGAGEGHGAAPVGSGLPPEAVPLAGVYVVLVEDDILVRAAMQAMLTQWGMLVETADSLAALAALLDGLERCPDLVVTDYRLSGDSTGVEVVQMVRDWIKREAGCRPVPVLLVTGEANSQGLGVAVGAGAILVKPAQPDELKKAIQALLAGDAPAGPG